MHRFCSNSGEDTIDMQAPDAASFVASLSGLIENPLFHHTPPSIPISADAIKAGHVLLAIWLP